MAEYQVIEIGEDSDRWLVVSQLNIHEERVSIDAARLAVIRTLREQLLPSEEDAFAACVEELLDTSAHRCEYLIVADDSGRPCYQSTVGRRAPSHWQRLGTCGVAFGFRLPSHHDLEVSRG